MKTLTITLFHHTTNYGAALQAYALQQAIKKLGHENDILDTVPTSKRKNKNFVPMQVVRTLYLKYLFLKRKKKVVTLKQHFSNFHNEYLQLTRPYRDMVDLRTDPNIKNYNCLITGSDQVWNLSTNPAFIDSRLLLFGPDNCIRFSYAASIEELNYNEHKKELVRNALKDFKGVSVREESARRYIESFAHVKCKRVIDPVFLLSKEDWMKIACKPRLQGPYILCYQVLRNKRMREVAYLLKKKTGYPIVSICNSAIRWIKSDYSFFDVSIEEFLGFYNQAAYVVSASFHGVAMGLVFDKPVYAMVKEVRANRIKEIMNIMGLQKYVVLEESKSNIPEYNLTDLHQMKGIKEKERSSGIEFLKTMLS